MFPSLEMIYMIYCCNVNSGLLLLAEVLHVDVCMCTIGQHQLALDDDEAL